MWNRLLTYFLAMVAMHLHFYGCLAFPPQCSLKETHFICTNAGLKTIPEGIPSSAYKIDLSNNPMLKFNDNYFIRFKGLVELYLENCGISHAVLLPPSLRSINLRRNLLTEEAVIKTFQNASNHITHVYLANNALMLAPILKYIPRSTKYLNLEYSTLPRINQDSFAGFKCLITLMLTACQIKEIAPNALDSAVQLKRLYLGSNQLESLPNGLFASTKSLIYLSLSNNRFKSIPDVTGASLEELHLSTNLISSVSEKDLYNQTIMHISLEYNRIESFNLHNTNYLDLDLSFNKIKRLDSFAFGRAGRQGMLLTLELENNSISDISPSAFGGLKEIGSLYLHRNSIKNLPKDVFRDMSIGNLFLYGNQIATMEGVIEQMSSAPDLLLLFSNPPLKHFRALEYKKMSSNSKIVITCSNLLHLTANIGIEAAIRCFPAANFSFYNSNYNLERSGFHCDHGGARHLCTPCPLGHYTDTDPCQKCPAGSFYQDEFGFSHCKTCPAGQYVPTAKAPGKSPLDCLTCPDGTKKHLSAGYRACSCLEGFSRTDRFGKCSKCSRDGISCKRDYPMLEEDHWWIWNGKSPSNISCQQNFKDFIENLEIESDSYDKGTSTFDCKLPEPQRCPISGACLGGTDASCLQNYTGVLCSVCQKGYSRSWQKCVKCPSPLIASLQFAGYILLFLVVCALISWADKIQLQNEDHHLRTFADVLLSNLKILLGFYQVLVSIIHTFSSINWPISLRKAIGVFEVIQFQIFRVPSLSCIRTDWGLNAIHEFWLALIATVAVPITILVYYQAKKAYLYFSIDDPLEFIKWRKICKKSCLRVLVLFLFVTYPLTSQKIVQILPIGCHNICTIMDKGDCLHHISYMRADYSLKCLSTNDFTLIIAYIAIIIPLGLPVLLFFLLHKYAQQDNDTEVDRSEIFPFDNEDRVQHSSMRFALKFLFENYNSSNRFWEALELLRKLIMTAGVSMFVGHYKIGINSTIMVAFIFAILHAYRHPIKNKFENSLQLLSLSIIPINLCLAAFLKSSLYETYMQQKLDDLIIGYILVALNMLVIVMVCIRLLPKFLTILWTFLTATAGLFKRICFSDNDHSYGYSEDSSRELLLN